jgi:hypothetical protein
LAKKLKFLLKIGKNHHFQLIFGFQSQFSGIFSEFSPRAATKRSGGIIFGGSSVLPAFRLFRDCQPARRARSVADMNEESESLKRIDQNMQKMARMMRGVRKQSSIRIMGLPLYQIATGPDWEAGEMRGHARGILAIGDFATGVIAIGGLARGVIALGGCAVGLIAFGGAALGALLAVGGGAVGFIAIGGGAVGFIALGGGAFGCYACGGGAGGAHVLSSMRQDPEMLDLIRKIWPGFTLPPMTGHRCQ